MNPFPRTSEPAEPRATTARRHGRPWRTALGSVAVATGLALGLAACGSSSSSSPSSSSSAPTTVQLATQSGPSVVYESLVIVTGSMTHHPGWPQYVDSAQLHFPAHTKIVLTITSYDDGTSPLTSSYASYDKVQGTLGGDELVNGQPVTSVPNAQIAHTFSVPSLGLNLPIPAAPTVSSSQPRQPVQVTATFELSKTGDFTWYCFAPCGTGADGMGGPMTTPGYMTGQVVVYA
jgi:hypothetical protein